MPLPAHTVRFGPFQLDLGAAELRHNGIKIKLPEQPFRILTELIERPGEVVTREQLRQRLWSSETFVDFEHGLNAAVKRLRELLGDSAENPRYIETLPRHGYRLIVPVEKAKAGDATTRKSLLRAWKTWLPLSIVLVGAVGIALIWRGRLLQRPRPVKIESLAVLPFENLSGDSTNDYFADGFTDQLITDIAEQCPIRVVSRSSVMRYKGSTKPLPEIARELKVDAIVEGAVALSERQVRITVQLIQAPSDHHLWAHGYERDRKDLFAIQGEVAAAIANLVGARTKATSSLVAASARSPEPISAANYELFLECRDLWRQATDESVGHAIQCYQHLLDIDPHRAAAYAALAECYIAIDPSKAEAPAKKALELDPSLPEAHLAMAELKLSHQRDLAGAGREFEIAMELNPSYAMAHLGRAETLLVAGRTAEAIAEAKRARELDPFSAVNATFSGRIFFMARQFDETIAEEKAALELDNRRKRAHYWLGYAYEQKRMYKAAITEYEKVLPNDDHGIFLAALGRAYVLVGDFKKVAEVKYKIQHYSGRDSIWPYDAALFYAVLGDKDRAFEWLDKENSGWLLFLRIDPRLANLQSDPRLEELARRIGLPE